MPSASIPLKAQNVVAKFEAARESLNAFRTKHSRLIEEYESLISDYNSSIENVKTVYREKSDAIGPRLGDFKLQQKNMVSPDKLVEILGDQAEPYVKVKYSIDRPAYDKAVATGDIPDAVRDSVEYVEIAIMGPAKA